MASNDNNANSNYFITSKKIYHSFIVYSFWYLNLKEANKNSIHLFDFPLLELLPLLIVRTKYFDF